VWRDKQEIGKTLDRVGKGIGSFGGLGNRSGDVMGHDSTSLYRWFIYNFSDIVILLMRLTRKNIPFFLVIKNIPLLSFLRNRSSLLLFLLILSPTALLLLKLTLWTMP
jgi:hypothetical protein